MNHMYSQTLCIWISGILVQRDNVYQIDEWTLSGFDPWTFLNYLTRSVNICWITFLDSIILGLYLVYLEGCLHAVHLFPREAHVAFGSFKLNHPDEQWFLDASERQCFNREVLASMVGKKINFFPKLGITNAFLIKSRRGKRWQPLPYICTSSSNIPTFQKLNVQSVFRWISISLQFPHSPADWQDGTFDYKCCFCLSKCYLPMWCCSEASNVSLTLTLLASSLVTRVTWAPSGVGG